MSKNKIIKFKCRKCGNCCKMVKCSILTSENLCPIYENRPNICKVNFIEKSDEEKIKWCENLKEYFDKIHCYLKGE